MSRHRMTRDERTTRQHRILIAIRAGCALRDAARGIGLSAGTVHRWRKTDVEFYDEYRRAMQVARDEASRS